MIRKVLPGCSQQSNSTVREVLLIYQVVREQKEKEMQTCSTLSVIIDPESFPNLSTML